MLSSAPESRLWQHTKNVLLLAASKDIYLRRIENLLSAGHPDVEFCYMGSAGSIELKQRPAWPKRPTTPVRIPHYTKGQQDDIKERILAGGRAFLLLQVADTYMLFDGPHALLVGRLNKADLIANACRVWRGRICGDELLEELTR